MILPHVTSFCLKAQKYFLAKPKKDFKNASNDWVSRLKLCISVGDEHFEGTT